MLEDLVVAAEFLHALGHGSPAAVGLVRPLRWLGKEYFLVGLRVQIIFGLLASLLSDLCQDTISLLFWGFLNLIFFALAFCSLL